MSTRLRRAPSLDALSSTNLAARSTKTRSSAKIEKYSSDEYSGRDSSEERSGRARRRRSKKTGRDRSVSATRPRVGIGGTGIEEKDFGRESSGRDRPSSARTDTKPVIMRDRPQTARPSDDRRSSISSIQIGTNNKIGV
ncbi:unnamed protein product [Oikopleura dioica]|uniref:Uncharacterized protein n=1 Tax=Oikopleura dioica TaxID=34765 RepID=E4WRC4_OIKDI|nr:unnamed protein product [Oikopleura dioica]